MSIRRTMLLAVLGVLGLANAPAQAGGHVSIGVGFGVPGPFYYRPYPYYYRPYYYAPYPAVYVAPRPIYVVPPPQPVYVQPGIYQAPGYVVPQYVPAPQPVPVAPPQPLPQPPPPAYQPPAPPSNGPAF